MISAVDFIERTLVDPETGKHFVLTAAERAFLRHAFTLTPDGRLKYTELIFSAPKKTGKTAFAAFCCLYVLGGRFGEAYCIANDFEQAQGRVFQAISRITEASPTLARDATITANKITFTSSGSTITAIASDYAGAAGANPTITIFDELWGVISERGHRLFDELVPVPTRRVSCRLTTTYAGFEGESTLLEGLHKRGLKGEQVAPDLYEQPGCLMFWTNRHTSPWQTAEWREQMREQLRPNAYLRMIENRWVSSDSTFVDMAWWDACVDADATPVISDPTLGVWCGVDASVKRDSTAIVACAWSDELKKARLVMHRIFQPTRDEPLDFEATIEATPMVEFNQTSANLTEASTNLYELVKGRNIIVYPDAGIRLAIQRSIAVETPRGWRIAKEKTSHKIDVVIALGMAALGAVQASGSSYDSSLNWVGGPGIDDQLKTFQDTGVVPPPRVDPRLGVPRRRWDHDRGWH